MNAPVNEDNNLLNARVFMLRLWLEDLGNGENEWRGKAQYVNSGEVIYFREWSILETFVEGFLGDCLSNKKHLDMRDKPSKGLTHDENE